MLHEASADKGTRKKRAEALLQLGTIFSTCKSKKSSTDDPVAAKQKMEDAVQLVAERRHAQAS